MALALLIAACSGSDANDDIFTAPDPSTTLDGAESSADDESRFGDEVAGGGSVEAGTVPDNLVLEPDEGSMVVLTDEPTPPEFWGPLGIVFTSVTAMTIGGFPGLAVEFEAQNAIDLPREFPLELLNFSYGDGPVFPISFAVDREEHIGRALVFPGRASVEGTIYVTTQEVLTTIEGMTVRIGTAQEVGIEIPLDGQPLDNPEYPINLDVAGVGPVRFGPGDLDTADSCETEFDLAIDDIVADAKYPGSYEVVPVGVRTINVFLNAQPITEPSGGCPSIAELLLDLDVSVLGDGQPAELVLSDSNPEGFESAPGTVAYIAIFEVPPSIDDVQLVFGDVDFVSDPLPVDLPLFLNEG